jgi:hypothetical protein
MTIATSPNATAHNGQKSGTYFIYQCWLAKNRYIYFFVAHFIDLLALQDQSAINRMIKNPT